MSSNKKRHYVIRVFFSIIVLLYTQLIYAGSMPIYPLSEVSICKGTSCGDIKLARGKETLTIQNNSLASIIIKDITSENSTVEIEKKGLPYQLPQQNEYQFIVNTTATKVDGQGDIKIIYNNGGDGEQDQVANVKVTFVSEEEAVIDLEPLQIDLHYSHVRGTTMVQQAASAIYTEEQYKEKYGVPFIHVGGWNGSQAEYIPRPPVKVFEFKKPGLKKLKLVNKWREGVTILGVFFDIKKTSAIQTARGVAIQGLELGHEIASGGSYELQVQAKENASSSIYPDGEHFFIAYKVKIGEQEETRFAEFKVQVKYNEDIGFYERNFVFGDSEVLRDFYLKNKNKNQTIKIKQVGFLNWDKKVDLEALDLAPKTTGAQVWQINCSTLKSGDICRVLVNVDIDAKDGVIPIYVKYDVCEGNDDACRNIVAQDVITTAVVVVHRNKSSVKDDNVVEAVDDHGFSEAAEEIAKKVAGQNTLSVNAENSLVDPTRAVGNGITKEAFKIVVKKVATSFLGEAIGSKQPLTPWFVGIIHSGFINKALIGKPASAIQSIAITSLGKAVVSEIDRGIRDSKSPNFFATLGCDMPANLVGLWVDLFLFPKGEYLPENWEGWFTGYHNTIIYTVTGVVKVGCLSALGYNTPVSALVAVAGETIAGAYKDYTT